MRMTQEKKEKNEIVVLGAPPRKEDEDSMELPDILDTPQSPTVSDITVLRLVLFYIGIILIFFRLLSFFPYGNLLFFIFFSTASSPNNRSESPSVYSGYSSDELSENEYADPFEGEGPYSNTPPPPCDRPDHDLCVPPAWGDRIPGSPVLCRCVLCHEDSCIQAVRCIQCLNAPRCCS